MGRAALVAALTLALAALEGTAGAGGAFEPECHFGLSPSREPNALIFTSRCNFEQQRVEVVPSRRVEGVDHSPVLSRRVDPEDHFRCRESRGASRVVCGGQAGKGARLKGLFETRRPSCEVEATIGVLGGVDCEPGQGCIEIAYGDTSNSLTPRGC